MRILTVIFLLLFAWQAKAQDFLGTAGDISGGDELEYTLGEVAVNLFPGCEAGFLVYSNYDCILTDIRDLSSPGQEIEIINRPASCTLILNRTAETMNLKTTYAIYSTTGILYKYGTMTDNSCTISYEGFPAGLYLLRITTETGAGKLYEWIKK